MSKFRFTPILLALLYAMPVVGFAEEFQDDGAVITADENIYIFPEITISGSNMPVDIAKYPGSVTVLTSDDVISYSSLEQALDAMVPGVELSDVAHGRPFGSYISIRGLSAASGYVVIEQDGIKRDPVLYGNFYSSLRMDSTILKNVEVISGASSILHGGAMGGVISTTTKDPQDFIKPGKMVGFVSETEFSSQDRGAQALTAAVDFPNVPLDFMIHGRIESFGNTDQAAGGE